MATQPGIERLRPIREWLAKHKVAAAWTVPLPGIGKVSAYLVNMHVVILQVFEGSDGTIDGWEVYVATCSGNSTEETLAALDRHCSS